MADAHDERIVELEVRLAFQDHVIHQLDDFVRALSVRLEKVEREVAELKSTDRSPGLSVGPADEPPPHY